MPENEGDTRDGEGKTIDKPSQSWRDRLGTHSGALRRELATASRFAIVGLIGTLVHTCVAMSASLSGLLPTFLANILGFVIAFGVTFTGHHLWSFPGGHDKARRMRRYFVLSVAGFALNATILASWLAFTPWPRSLGLMIAILVVPGLSFIGSRLWAFAGHTLALPISAKLPDQGIKNCPEGPHD